MSLDARLLEILCCPDSHHAPLRYDEAAQTLTCTECARVFEIRDGIPVLLLDEATSNATGSATTSTETSTVSTDTPRDDQEQVR